MRISETRARGRRDEAVSGIRHEAGDESFGSHLEGQGQGDQMASGGGHFRCDAPDHQEDAGRYPGSRGSAAGTIAAGGATPNAEPIMN